MASLALLLGLAVSSVSLAAEQSPDIVLVRPDEYGRALKNPFMGFRPRKLDGSHEYGTLCRVYLKWNDLERTASDGMERIQDVCDKAWRDVEKHNIKVIPRVYLHWDGDKKYWPSDMKQDDYGSEQFKQRVLRLISRLGQCWDNDPRVAWVQLGLIGKWGEHHSPSVTPEMQKLLGDAFGRAFKNKMVTVRHPWDFKEYEVGIYWDSWAHVQQMLVHGGGIEKMGLRWQTRPMGGECAYNWGRWKEQPGENPDDTLRDPNHRAFLIDSIRRLHCNNLGWVAEYDAKDPAVRAGAEEVQKAFGYRFVIDEVSYPASLAAGRDFAVTFTVRNTGSSPMYGRWPVELSLLDPKTRKVVWSGTFKDLDIRKWLPGDRWDASAHAYLQKPATCTARGSFRLPESVVEREYILALAILDPAGMLPSARLAIRNYFQGGRHPIGRVGVGMAAGDPKLAPAMFDDPARDNTLHYIPARRVRELDLTELDADGLRGPADGKVAVSYEF